MGRTRLLLLLVVVGVSDCRCLFVNVPKFGQSCRVTDDEGRPLPPGELSNCPEVGLGREETYMCRSTGPDLDDEGFCVPLECDASGTLFLVAPSQVELCSLMLDLNGGGPCFDGVYGSLSAGFDGTLALPALERVDGDLTVEMLRVEDWLEGPPQYLVDRVELEDLEHVSGRLEIAPPASADGLEFNVRILGDALDRVSAPALVDVGQALLGTDELGIDPVPGDEATVYVGSPSLTVLDLSGFERMRELTVMGARSLERFELRDGVEIGQLTLFDTGTLAAGGGFLVDDDGNARVAVGRFSQVTVVDTGLPACEPFRYFTALVADGFDGYAQLGTTDGERCNGVDQLQGFVTGLCNDFADRFPDEPGLRCSP